jgi:membrane protease YdiL (CAAX protease family)
MPNSSRRQVVTYLFFVLLFSSIFYFLVIRAHQLSAGFGMYTLGIMWCPALAAFLTLKLNGRNFNELGWHFGPRRYIVLSWLIPLVYAGIAYVIIWSAGFGGFPNHEFMDSLETRMGLRLSPALSTIVYVLLTGTFGMARSLSSGLGEEIGWRGFLVLELAKTTSFTTTALISGIVWALWHWPILIFADYNNGTPAWYGLTCFTVLVVSIAVVFAWLRLKSGSLWTGAILHASHNLYVQAVFTPLTRNTGKTAWFIDEFGAVLPIVALCFAVYFWSRRKELRADQPQVEVESAARTAY